MAIPKMPKEFWTDQEWGFKNHTQLLKKYRDMWIAIVNKKVVASGLDLAKVQKLAQKKTGKKYIPVMFVESGSHIY
jgi:hypothetical protein